MGELNLDSKERHEFQHQAQNGYGVLVCGGSGGDRVLALRENIYGNVSAVNCEKISSKEDFIRSILKSREDKTETQMEDMLLGLADVKRAFESGDDGLLVLEIDTLDKSVQSDIFRLMKGLIESSEFTGPVGYTAESCETVSGNERIVCWKLENSE